MNNIAGGIDPTRKTDNNNIMQNRNCFYFEFSVESSSFTFNNFKTEKSRLPLKVETDQFVICLVLPECLSVEICWISPSDSESNRDRADAESLFRCFSLFLRHLRTLAQEKRSENCLRFGTGGPSHCLYPLSSRNILFLPALTMAVRAKKKSGEAICSRYRSACTIGILSALTYTEFDCAALLALL